MSEKINLIMLCNKPPVLFSKDKYKDDGYCKWTITSFQNTVDHFEHRAINRGETFDTIIDKNVSKSRNFKFIYKYANIGYIGEQSKIDIIFVILYNIRYDREVSAIKMTAKSFGTKHNIKFKLILADKFYLDSENDDCIEIGEDTVCILNEVFELNSTMTKSASKV